MYVDLHHHSFVPVYSNDKCTIEGVNYNTTSGFNLNQSTGYIYYDTGHPCSIFYQQNFCPNAKILANKTLDVYLNGRLNSSCAYNYIPLESSGNIYVNQFGGYDGSISELTHVNKALSAGEVYSLYSNGYEPMNIFKKMWRFIN